MFRFTNAVQPLSLYRHISHSAGTVFSGGGVLNSRFINGVIRPETHHRLARDRNGVNALSSLLALNRGPTI